MIESLKKNSSLTVGLGLLLVLFIIALLAPYITNYGPNELSNELLAKPGTNGHLLGTDNLGADVFSNIIHGTKTSLTIGFVAAAISALIGILLGSTAGFYGGKVDAVFSEFINIFVMTPSFFLILIIIAFFGSNIVNVMIVIGLTSWVSNARLMRAQAMTIKEKTFVKSAEVLGERKSKIMFTHIIPNGIYPVIANTIMGISSAILVEASLSFLGLGDPNIVSWGQIISSGRGHLATGWWITVFPGLMIVFTVLALFLVGDGVNKMLSPKMKD